MELGYPGRWGRKIARVYMHSYHPRVLGDLSRGYCGVAEYVNRQNGRGKAHSGG